MLVNAARYCRRTLQLYPLRLYSSTAEFDVNSLGDLSRRDLQGLAKKCGIKANLKTVDLISSLQKCNQPQAAAHVQSPSCSKLYTGVMCVPHPDKVQQGARGSVGKYFGNAGEDAYFIYRDDVAHSRRYMMGVADGVYEWAIQGIDAGVYARRLVGAAYEECSSTEKGKPLDILECSYESVTSEGIQGSTTALFAAVDLEKMRLEFANLGDSALLVVGKDGMVRGRSTAQEHIYGCPFQLGHHEQASQPSNADCVKIHLEEGDVIILGTDGLFDNVLDHAIAEKVHEFTKEAAHSGKQNSWAAVAGPLARELVKIAFELSMDKHAVTPYSISAQKEFDMIFNGGKKDDITVVVGVISGGGPTEERKEARSRT